MNAGIVILTAVYVLQLVAFSLLGVQHLGVWAGCIAGGVLLLVLQVAHLTAVVREAMDDTRHALVEGSEQIADALRGLADRVNQCAREVAAAQDGAP